MDSSFWHQVDASTVSYEQLQLQEEQQQSTVIFDNTNVYQRIMLQDFLSFSMEGDGTAEEAATQRLHCHAMKDSTASSKKQTSVVDHWASKGQKIQYNAEIPKLVNFTFPVAWPPVSRFCPLCA